MGNEHSGEESVVSSENTGGVRSQEVDPLNQSIMSNEPRKPTTEPSTASSGAAGNGPPGAPRGEVDELVDDIKELAKDTFGATLQQTVSMLNAFKGSGDECHAQTIVNADGVKLAGYHWKPRAFKIGGKKVRMPGGPRAVVFILHGAGEHCQWYDPIAKTLNAQGVTVCAHDHVGHGLSEGDRVHVENFSDYVRDAVQHIEILRNKYPESPLFLLGHSMGGTMAIKVALDNKDIPFKGVILIGPAIIPNPETVTTVKVLLAKLVARLRPQFEVAPIEPEWVSRDPEIVKRYQSDPLVWHGGLKAKWSTCMLDTMTDIQGRLAEVTWPYLLLHGDQDKLCELSGSQLFDQLSASKDKTFKIYEGGYHQLHNEPDGMGIQCLQDITDWVVKRI